MIVIQMLYTQSWLDLAKVTTPNLVSYCRKHGYSWNIQCISEPYDGFEKIRQILKCFEAKECEVVWSMDCDSGITDYGKRFEDFTDASHDVFFTTDINGLNCGIFGIKKSAWSITFLKMLLSYHGQDGMECEQNAVDRYIKTNGTHKIKIIKDSCFNDYPLDEYKPNYGKWDYKEGDVVEVPHNNWNDKSFIIHVPGLPYNRRLELLKQHT